MKDLDELPFDAVARIGSFLSVSELQRLLLINSAFYQIGLKPEIWKQWINLISKQSIESFWFHRSMGQPFEQASISDIKELAREAFCLSHLSTMQWKRVQYHKESKDSRLFPMEAHTTTSILDRYVAVTAGWCRSPHANRISFLDAWALPHQIVTITTKTLGNPDFRYGFSTLMWKGRLVIYGGCKEGGYSADCNDLYFVTCTFVKLDEVENGVEQETEYNLHDETYYRLLRTAPIKYWNRIDCRYSDNMTLMSSTTSVSSASPIERAYHGCALTVFNDQDCMIVWGGLHANDVIGQLELYDLENKNWLSVTSSGTEPSPRFGLSMMPVSSTNGGKVDKFIVTGGSDGNDLIRNGDELLDIHVLEIIRGNAWNGESDSFVWSQLNLGVNMNLIPGRCHTAVALENYIIYFGGSAENSNSTSVLQVSSDNNGIGCSSSTTRNNHKISLQLIRPHLCTGLRPSTRTSSAAAIIGRYMLIFGGWSNNLRELGDFWVLDLAPGNEVSSRSVPDETCPNHAFVSELFSCKPQEGVDEAEDTSTSYQSNSYDIGDDDPVASMLTNPFFLQQALVLMGNNLGIDFTTAMQMLMASGANEEEGEYESEDGNDFDPFNPSSYW